MNIILNGQPRDAQENMPLKDLIANCVKHPEHVIAELNGQIIPRDQWAATTLNTADKLELVTFVGGG